MNYNAKILCPEYRAFIHSKPCCECGGKPVHFDHLKARGFGAGKQNDLTGIPLCWLHHSERHQIGNEKFEAKHHINLWHVATMLLTEFFVDTERRATVKIMIGKEEVRL